MKNHNLCKQEVTIVNQTRVVGTKEEQSYSLLWHIGRFVLKYKPTSSPE